MATVTERLERAIEREAPSWGVRPTSSEVRRLSGLDFAILWGDLGIGLLVLVTGALLVPALGLPQAFLAIAVGSLIGCVPLALVGRAGAREGVPGMVLLRPTLGTRGSYLPTILNIAQLVGWTAFELWAMALVASRITGPVLGIDGFTFWLAAAALVCLLLSLGGPVVVVRRWMARFGVWVVVAVAAWVTVRVLTAADLGALWLRPGAGGFPPFWGAVDLVIAMPVSWIPLVADYNRFARRGSSSAGGTYAGYLVANLWFYSLGALLILGANAPAPSVTGIADGIVTLAGGSVVLVALLVGETDEAFADIYSAAVSAQNLVPRLNQRAGVAAVTAIGVGVAAWLVGLPDEGVLTYEFFLLLIGSIFVPLFGVFLADYEVVRRRRPYRAEALFDHRGPYRYSAGFNPAAMAAWFLGFATYHWIAPTSLGGWSSAVETLFADWLGLPFPLFGGAVPASVVAFAVAFAAYLAIAGVRRALSRPAAAAR
jgi:putative hydroxymethylpyrimidine transporter CytX